MWQCRRAKILVQGGQDYFLFYFIYLFDINDIKVI